MLAPYSWWYCGSNSRMQSKQLWARTVYQIMSACMHVPIDSEYKYIIYIPMNIYWHQVHIATGDSLTACMFFPEDIIRLIGNKHLFLVTSILFILSISINQELILIHIFIHLYHTHVLYNIWNSLPFDIVNASWSSYNVFKHSIWNYHFNVAL